MHVDPVLALFERATNRQADMNQCLQASTAWRIDRMRNSITSSRLSAAF
jgi:hypothetical protein